MNNPIWRRLILISSVVALLSAVVYAIYYYDQDANDDISPWLLTPVQRGDIEVVVTASGILVPRDYVDVGAQVSGQLRNIHVEIGSGVTAGTLLAEIDPTVMKSKVDASLAQLRNLRALLQDRHATLKLAKLQQQRQRSLINEEATSIESLQNAEASLTSAQAQIEALKAQIEMHESNLRADQANLEYSRIYAPMDGTVVTINARQGQTLNAFQSAPVILQIADLNTMTVQAQVSEADIGKLQLGMPAYFTTLGAPELRWHGKLQKIEPMPIITNNVVMYNALFDVPNRDAALMSHMTAQVFFVTAATRDVNIVPLSALLPSGKPIIDDDAAAVRVLNAAGKIETRQIRLGKRNRIHAEIVSGLKIGENVISGRNNSRNVPPRTGLERITEPRGGPR